MRLLEGRPIYQGGRDHTSHRLVYYGLSEKRAVILLALISASLGATSLGYTVLAELAADARRRARDVRAARPVRELPRRGRPRPGAERAARRAVRAFIVHRRRLIEVLVDAALITAAFVAAYIVRVNDTRTPWDRTSSTSPCP